MYRILPPRPYLISVGFRTKRTFKTVSVMSHPISLGQPYQGTDQSPTLLKEQGLLKMLSSFGWRINQLPELQAPGKDKANIKNDEEFNAKNCTQLGIACKNIHDQVLEQARTDNFLLILGGDHCIPIGTLPAILSARPNTGVVWVDAHADINTPATSPSGNMHGMPVGFLVGLVENANKFPSLEWFNPCLKPKDLVYIGLRDLDAAEKIAIKKLGIKAYTVSVAIFLLFHPVSNNHLIII